MSYTLDIVDEGLLDLTNFKTLRILYSHFFQRSVGSSHLGCLRSGNECIHRQIESVLSIEVTKD